MEIIREEQTANPSDPRWVPPEGNRVIVPALPREAVAEE